jgi:type II secretory pathway component PulF
MPLLAALDAARDAAGDQEIAVRLGRAREQVARGIPVAGALGQEAAFTAVALHLVAVGEASGQLAGMVSRAGELAGHDAERTLATLVGLLEPALVILLGGFVAFVAAALLQAVYSLRPGGV